MASIQVVETSVTRNSPPITKLCYSWVQVIFFNQQQVSAPAYVARAFVNSHAQRCTNFSLISFDGDTLR